MEYRYHDGEGFVTFWIYDTNENVATIAVSKMGKTTFQEFDLFEDEDGTYFEYGLYQKKIHFNDFEICDY